MTDRTVVGIHQPNFFPWLGYFDKIRKSDVFILMDNVQYPKGSWVNRVRVLVNRQPAWLTLPVARHAVPERRIVDVRSDERTPWREKIRKTLQANYARTPHFREVLPILSDLIANPATSVADFNSNAIVELARLLGIDRPRIVRGSALDAGGSATDLLISMVRSVGGDTYLAGGGAAEYQEDEKFARAGLSLSYQSFRHPVYRQLGVSEFIPGLSIIDALFHCGVDGTRMMLCEGQVTVAEPV
jgi:hypothetical protein